MIIRVSLKEKSQKKNSGSSMLFIPVILIYIPPYTAGNCESVRHILSVIKSFLIGIRQSARDFTCYSTCCKFQYRITGPSPVGPRFNLKEMNSGTSGS